MQIQISEISSMFDLSEKYIFKSLAMNRDTISNVKIAINIVFRISKVFLKSGF